MIRLLFCNSCSKRQPVETTELGYVCCTLCGKVVDHDIYSNEPSFVKNAAGQSQLAGNYVKTVQTENAVSRERTLNRAYDYIIHMAENLGVGGGDLLARPAVRFYEIAVEKNFVRGRKAEQVQAACLYIACRDNNKPFLLIEFSEFLRVNVYVLGAVFLQLCKVLHLQEHPIVQKPVDPSLFIHRFANVLLGEVNHDVEKTALRIMASMKLNWMQTGRKPSGLCGAALYISALSHGFKFSKAEIVKHVHICEATLTKRLIEFEGTESGGLTIEEFNQKAEELDRNGNKVKHTNFGDNMIKGEELLCKHKGGGEPQFAHGLCESCYHEFIKLSGGLDGGSEPPAFQRAERERLAVACANEMAADSLMEPAFVENSCEHSNMEKERRLGADGIDQMAAAGVRTQHEAVDDGGEEYFKSDYMGVEGDESGNLSDIDDDEVAGYLYNEEQMLCKKQIWEGLNQEYLQEQAAKEAEAAAREAMMAKFENGSAQALDAKKLADEAAANYAKLKKGRQLKRAAETKNPQTTAEAVQQMLSKKRRTSTNIKYDRLKELFDEPAIPDKPKKSQSETNIEKNGMSWTNKTEAEGENNEDELETVDECEEGNYGDYQDNGYYEEDYEAFDDGLF
ncbi:transcription factor IIIB 90 kDa subunit-like isoform X1 [Chenopodium quinoa]|uniref:transcription factor IIIB 90 kDa subunit-like isoform X1 n=1 Tax=Chenopodium quinoa TaxID=63459 RepID=UPI000B7792F9|nr:transcription factor IIIB 90 kDa subunit-like isoform X1 [Chenopodium quinoa]